MKNKFITLLTILNDSLYSFINIIRKNGTSLFDLRMGWERFEYKKIKLIQIDCNVNRQNVKAFNIKKGKYFYNLKKLENSIKKYGYQPKEFNSYIKLTDKYSVIGGNHRVMVLREMFGEQYEIDVMVCPNWWRIKRLWALRFLLVGVLFLIIFLLIF